MRDGESFVPYAALGRSPVFSLTFHLALCSPRVSAGSHSWVLPGDLLPPWAQSLINIYSKFPLLSLQVSSLTTSILKTNFWLKQLKFYVITVLEATQNSSAIISWHLLNNFVVRNRTNEGIFTRGVKVDSLVSVKITLNSPFF